MTGSAWIRGLAVNPDKPGAPSRYLRVTFHDDLTAFQRAARKYAPELDWSETVGAWHPTQRMWDASPGPYLGHMRLSLDVITPEVVMHESLHAALTAWRMEVAHRVNLGDNCGSREEAFCHLAGHIAAEALAAAAQIMDARRMSP